MKELSADNVLFGNIFDRALSLPYGSGAAIKFMQYADPTLEDDLYGDNIVGVRSRQSSEQDPEGRHLSTSREHSGAVRPTDAILSSSLSLEKDMKYLNTALKESRESFVGALKPWAIPVRRRSG